MPASLITVDDLALTPGFGQIFARWSITDPYWNSIEQLRFDKVELWSNSVNDRGPDGALLATKVDEGLDRGEHIGLGSSVGNYYWARSRDRSGSYGPWNPSSQTGGLLGTTALITAFDGGVPVSWQSYTPVITSSSGALGGVANVSGKYVIAGNVCFVNVAFDITNNGTGSGRLEITLPISSVDAGSGIFPAAIGSGRRQSDAKQLRTSATGSLGATMVAFLYDGTYPGAVASYTASLVYQIADSWTDFSTFGVTAGSGSFTSITGKRGKYKRLGKVIFYNFQFSIATNGSAATSIIVDLPTAAEATTNAEGAVQLTAGALASGYASILSGGAGISTLTIKGYDGSYPGATGAQVNGSIAYEG